MTDLQPTLWGSPAYVSEPKPDYQRYPDDRVSRDSYRCVGCGIGTFGSGRIGYFRDVCRRCFDQEAERRGAMVWWHGDWNDPRAAMRSMSEVVRAAERWADSPVNCDEFNPEEHDSLLSAVDAYRRQEGDGKCVNCGRIMDRWQGQCAYTDCPGWPAVADRTMLENS